MASYQRLSNEGLGYSYKQVAQPQPQLQQQGPLISSVSLALQNHRMIRTVMVFGILVVTIFLYVCYYTTPMPTTPHMQLPETQPQSSVAAHQSPVLPDHPPIVLHNDQNFFVLVNATGSAATGSFSNNGSIINSGLGLANTSTLISGGNGISIGGPGDVIGGNENATSDPKTPPRVSSPKGADQSELEDARAEQSPRDDDDQSPIMSLVGTKRQEIEPNIINIPKVEPPSKKEISKMLGQDMKNKTGTLDPANGIRTSEIYEPGHSEPALDICADQGEQVNLLVLITSAPSHRDERLAIRQTWGHYGTRRDTALGFVLGATQDAKLEEQLSEESFVYGDLIRGNSIDSYNNLTLKTISMLEWVDTYCNRAKFFLKTDDDMFINVPKLVQFIEKHKTEKRRIFGRLAKRWKPIRNHKSKYYVSPKQYFPKYFPDFTTGPAYLMTSDVIHDLYVKSLNETYLKLEDVFTTGIVAELMKVKRIHVTEFLNRRIGFKACTIKKAISVHMVKGKEQFDLWKKLMDPSLQCK